MRLLVLLLLLGCGARNGSTPFTSAPEYAPEGVDWAAMHGDLPAIPKEPPLFHVENQDGKSRTATDLLFQVCAVCFSF